MPKIFHHIDDFIFFHIKKFVIQMYKASFLLLYFFKLFLISSIDIFSWLILNKFAHLLSQLNTLPYSIYIDDAEYYLALILTSIYSVIFNCHSVSLRRCFITHLVIDIFTSHYKQLKPDPKILSQYINRLYSEIQVIFN
jgi:hypothetical protein